MLYSLSRSLLTIVVSQTRSSFPSALGDPFRSFEPTNALSRSLNSRSLHPMLQVLPLAFA